jgi:hypothetical protein
MLWKRSVITDCDYKFLSSTTTLTLNKEQIKLDTVSGAQALYRLFDPEGALNFEEAVTGHELIYTADEHGRCLNFFSTKEWTGPLVNPEEEIEWDFPTPVDDLLEHIADINPEALYPSDMKDAVIGIVERFGMQPLVLLDRDKCLQILVNDGMTEDEASEYFEFNTIGAWVGPGTPCFATIDKRLV